MRRLLLFVTIVLALSACSLQRRVYNRGYYIEGLHKKHAFTAAVSQAKDSSAADTVAVAVTASPAANPDPVVQIADTAARSTFVRKLVLRETEHITQQVHVFAPHAQLPSLTRRQLNPVPRETIKDALILALIADFIIGPLTLLVLLQPDLLLSGSGSSHNEGIVYILSCPLISVVLVFFALRAIVQVMGALAHSRGRKTVGLVALGLLSILLCLVAAGIGVGTMVYLVAHPVIFIIVAIAAVLSALLTLLDS